MHVEEYSSSIFNAQWSLVNRDCGKIAIAQILFILFIILENIYFPKTENFSEKVELYILIFDSALEKCHQPNIVFPQKNPLRLKAHFPKTP